LVLFDIDVVLMHCFPSAPKGCLQARPTDRWTLAQRRCMETTWSCSLAGWPISRGRNQRGPTSEEALAKASVVGSPWGRQRQESRGPDDHSPRPGDRLLGRLARRGSPETEIRLIPNRSPIWVLCTTRAARRLARRTITSRRHMEAVPSHGRTPQRANSRARHPVVMTTCERAGKRPRRSKWRSLINVGETQSRRGWWKSTKNAERRSPRD